MSSLQSAIRLVFWYLNSFIWWESEPLAGERYYSILLKGLFHCDGLLQRSRWSLSFNSIRVGWSMFVQISLFVGWMDARLWKDFSFHLRNATKHLVTLSEEIFVSTCQFNQYNYKYWVGILICNHDVLNHFRQVFWPQQQNSLPYNFNHNCTVVNIRTIYNIQSTSQ